MRAEIISVGTELLLGQIVDTNAAYLARELANLGIDVFFKQTVGDNTQRVQDAVRLALGRSEAILMTGGLGPTEDDLTVEAVAAAVGDELVHDADVAAHVKRFFESRGRVPPASVYKQALVPRPGPGPPGRIPPPRPRAGRPSRSLRCRCGSGGRESRTRASSHPSQRGRPA